MIYTVLFDFSDGLLELRTVLKAPDPLEDEVGDTVYQTPFEAEEVAKYLFDSWKYNLGLEPAVYLVEAEADWERDTQEYVLDDEESETTSNPQAAMKACPFPEVYGRELKREVPVRRVLREVVEG